MRPREEIKRGLVLGWLDKADADLNAGRHLLSGEGHHSENVAFHSQQAVEKYLKAFLAWHQVEFPKTHDIGRLLELAGTRDSSLATQAAEAADLTAYGVEYRYPGDYPDVSLEEAKRCIEIAEFVRQCVVRRLRPEARV